MIIVKKKVRVIAKGLGKRVSKSFVYAIDDMVNSTIVQAARNAGKFKTLQAKDIERR